MKAIFRRFANARAKALGTSWAFIVAIVMIIVWVVTGPLFGFRDTWQLILNTGTIVTFLMVFLIQNTQNRETRSIQLKLDELLKGVAGARTSMVSLEELSDEKLDELKVEFTELATDKPVSAGKRKPAAAQTSRRQPARPKK